MRIRARSLIERGYRSGRYLYLPAGAEADVDDEEAEKLLASGEAEKAKGGGGAGNPTGGGSGREPDGGGDRHVDVKGPFSRR
jgi:hypothetical protein